MLPLIIKRLKNHVASRIKFLTQEEMQNLAELVHARKPLVDNVIEFVDGVSILSLRRLGNFVCVSIKDFREEGLCLTSLNS